MAGSCVGSFLGGVIVVTGGLQHAVTCHNGPIESFHSHCPLPFVHSLLFISFKYLGVHCRYYHCFIVIVTCIHHLLFIDKYTCVQSMPGPRHL
jgi:hypothetical protein